MNMFRRSLALFCAFGIHSLHAAPPVPPTAPPATTPAAAPVAPAEPTDTVSVHARRHHLPPLALSLIPRYVHLSRTPAAPAFTNNGFETQSPHNLGMAALLYWQTQSDWQLGLGFGWFTSDERNGANEASSMSGMFSFYFAKDFMPGSQWDLTVGAQLGYGMTEVTVFSAAQDGRTTEGAMVFEPSVGVAYKVGSWIKLGGLISYQLPLRLHSDTTGDDLGISKINPDGLTVGMQIIFSRPDDAQ